MHDIVSTGRLLAPAGVYFAAVSIGEIEELVGPEVGLVARAPE